MLKETKCLRRILHKQEVLHTIDLDSNKERRGIMRKSRVTGHKKGFYECYIKRLLDIFGAGMGMVLLSPVYVVTASLVRKRLGTPVIFCQRRPGLNGKVFSLYKFRTMTEKKGADGKLLPDEERLTSFGRKLRSSSLDELPELINVLKGDMSLVGPRPLLVEYLPRYTKEQARRHEVRPGITGLAQVHGRNAITWEEKFRWDVRYVNHITFLGDIKILVKTVFAVVRREGIHSETSATMEAFKGTSKD